MSSSSKEPLSQLFVLSFEVGKLRPALGEFVVERRHFLLLLNASLL
jgi:hypothetical protein